MYISCGGKEELRRNKAEAEEKGTKCVSFYLPISSIFNMSYNYSVVHNNPLDPGTLKRYPYEPICLELTAHGPVNSFIKTYILSTSNLHDHWFRNSQGIHGKQIKGTC